MDLKKLACKWLICKRSNFSDERQSSTTSVLYENCSGSILFVPPGAHREQGEGRHLLPLQLHDLADTLLLDLIDPDDGMHGDVAPGNLVELGLQPLLGWVNHDLAAFAKEEAFNFDESIEIALIDVLDIDLVDFSLVEKHDAIDGFCGH